MATAIANWSELPLEILETFADLLSRLKDFVRFGCVCKSWSSAAAQAKARRKPCEPWLVMATSKNDKISGEEGSVRSCYTLFTNKLFDLSLPELQGRRCWGTQYGWIITLGVDSQYHLFNPLTRARISLPPRSTFPDQGDYHDGQHMCRAFPGNFALSSDPTKAGDSVVVVAMYTLRRLAFATPRDKSWSGITTTFGANMDAIFFDGKLYSISTQGTLRICDMDASEPKALDITPPHPQLNRSGTMPYLVNIAGELHLIVRRYNEVDDEDYHVETYSFDFYKFDFQGAQWIKVSGFETHSLFVGNNTTFAISKSDYPDFNLKPNCIYYTDDQAEFYGRFFDVGVYDIEKTIIEPLNNQVDLPSIFSRPFIFVPSLE